MRAEIDYQPEADRYVFYLGTKDVAIYVEPGDPARTRLHQHLDAGQLRKPFLALTQEEYIAIRDAIIERESHHIGQNDLLRERLARADDLGDRLLALVEAGWHD